MLEQECITISEEETVSIDNILYSAAGRILLITADCRRMLEPQWDAIDERRIWSS